MDAIKTAGLAAYIALAESVRCSVEILFTTASSAVLSSSMINTRRTDPIIKKRTIGETGNRNAAGNKKTATANSMRKAISSKDVFLTHCKL